MEDILKTVYYPEINTVAHYRNGIVQIVKSGCKPSGQRVPVLISLSREIFIELPDNMKIA